MRSISEDRTARAIIRDEALRLFAAQGPDRVTVRQIATAAGVSPGLVVHHFGSKDGLLEAVDAWVVATFERMLGELTGDGGEELLDPAATTSLSEALMRHLPPDSPLPGYLRRLLLSDTPAGRQLFRRLFEVGQSVLTALALAGQAHPGADPPVRAAFLMVNDLAVLLLREQLTDVLGVDPLSPVGLARWAPEMLSIYAGGLNADPAAGKEGPTP